MAFEERFIKDHDGFDYIDETCTVFYDATLRPEISKKTGITERVDVTFDLNEMKFFLEKDERVIFEANLILELEDL